MEETKSEVESQPVVSDEPHQLISMRFLGCRVCSTGTWDEALEWVRRAHPAGTSNNWSKDEEPLCAPLTCRSDPKRTHYMFVC